MDKFVVKRRKLNVEDPEQTQHLFFIEREINQYVPYWFLEETTREEAEEILKQSNGNVLMRKHSSYPVTGKYIISYQKDTSVFRHYVVLNTPDGYRLDVDHRNNHPVNCLSEVMELFIHLTGRNAQVINQSHESSLPAMQQFPTTSSNYVNVPNVKQSLDQTVPPNKEADKTRTHSYINTPQGSNSSETKSTSTSHDYVNTPRIKTHSYVNDVKVFGEQ